MPRTDPPPTKKAEPLGEARYRSSSPPESGEEDIDLETEIMLGDDEIGIGSAGSAPPQDNDVEITTGESEIALADLELEEGDDPCPSPYERITVAPEVSEREYVARMMREAPESDPAPVSRAVTPPPEAPSPEPAPRASGTVSTKPSTHPSVFETMSVDSISSWPAPEDIGELTLDLVDSVPPPGDGSSESSAPPPSIPPPPSLPDTSTGVRGRILFDTEPHPHETEPAPPETDPPLAPPIKPLSFGPASGDALELVGVRAQSVKPPGPPRITMRAVRDRFDVGDFSGALILAEGILEHDPESVDALLYAEHCRDVLKNMYISRLGGVGRVPQVAISDEQLRWLNLDHRAGFLLSLVDGHSSFEEVLDVSGMPPVEALRLLMELLQQNVIKVE
jgi:hypothetical protein